MSTQSSVTQINEQINSRGTATNQAETTKQIDLRTECNKTPYLDGKFFEVDFKKSSEDGSSMYAKCVHCIPKQSIKGSLKISSNYVSHLKRKHPDLYSEYNIYKNAKRQRMERPNVIRRTTCSFSQELFEENVTRYILESMSPSSTVMLPAFRQMFDSFRIKHGDKPLKHLARNTLKKKIDIIYSEQIKIIKNYLKNVKYVCTTADVWTAPDRRIIGVTAHWLCEKTLKRKSAALACKRIEGTHTAEVIAIELARIHALFGVNNEKLVATVTDNGSNFIKAFKIFGLSSSSILEIERLSLNNADELEELETNDSAETNNDKNINETDEDNDNNSESDDCNDDDDDDNCDNIDNISVEKVGRV